MPSIQPKKSANFQVFLKRFFETGSLSLRRAELAENARADEATLDQALRSFLVLSGTQCPVSQAHGQYYFLPNVKPLWVFRFVNG